MTILLINSIPVDARAGSGSRETIRLGERSRAFSGRARKSERSTKRESSIQTGHLTALEGAALRGLVEGHGQYWSFNDTMFSSNGLLATGGTSSLGTTSPTPKYGTKRLGITAGTVTFATQIGTTWTVSIWKHSGSIWEHWLFCSDGTKYKDGAVTVTTTSWFSVVNGSVLLTTGNYDDLVAMPYAIPASWRIPWSVSYTPAWSALPYISVSGDLIGTLTCLGEVTGEETVSFQGPDGWEPAGRILTFTLAEI